MATNHWTPIARDAGLPRDAEPLVIKSDYAVARSESQRLVFRIGIRGSSSFDLNPSDVAHAHKIGVDMATRGLNVLAPLTPEPLNVGRYQVSTSPLALPIMEASWNQADAAALGRELRAWSAYDSPLLTQLDIADYVRTRAQDAISSGGMLAAAGEWCLNSLDALNTQAPFTELVDSHHGAIHGDVHPGNLVRYEGRILLIDLDSVKTGPAMFDIAVGLTYQRRYNTNYPGTTMASAYIGTSQDGRQDELAALQKWKELSSYSQLLLRWHHSPAIQDEFWNRTKSTWEAHWANVVQTPVLSTTDKH